MSDPRPRKQPRHDPRAEASEGGGEPPSSPAIDVVSNVKIDALAASAEASPGAPSPKPSADASGATRAMGGRDPRWRIVEPLLAASDWAGVVERLGPPDDATKLPPALALLYAVAKKELQAARSELRSDNQQAIDAMAHLLGVAPDSPAALVLAKRLLRRNPGIAQTEAPGVLPSLFIALAFIVVGGAVGYMLAFGGAQGTSSGSRGFGRMAPRSAPVVAPAPAAALEQPANAPAMEDASAPSEQ